MGCDAEVKFYTGLPAYIYKVFLYIASLVPHLQLSCSVYLAVYTALCKLASS